MITTQIIADSISPSGNRITTGLWTYPRFIHSEIMTHRMLVKNSASSRAIPVEKMIQAVLENPALFEQYGKANKGMSAQELMDETTTAQFLEDWTRVSQQCAHFADLWKNDAAKQMVNRALEPWMHMTVVITGTDWHNFFALRAHPAAQPEFQVLAYRWLNKYMHSTPVVKEYGEWHLPFASPYEERQGHVAIHDSVARIARVSYTKHDAEDTPEKNRNLHDRLTVDGHFSPTEHPAQCKESNEYFGPFKGWMPYRKMIPNENRHKVDLQSILDNKPSWIEL